MKLFDLHVSKGEKEKLKAIGYEGIAIASGEYGLAAREAEAIVPKRYGMKLMAIL